MTYYVLTGHRVSRRMLTDIMTYYVLTGHRVSRRMLTDIMTYYVLTGHRVSRRMLTDIMTYYVLIGNPVSHGRGRQKTFDITRSIRMNHGEEFQALCGICPEKPSGGSCRGCQTL
ncbi:hypothetical protein RRG08_009564 [Elysia crispata]|uniref:Uncharacterized protein n=1 Tax=Elysia crispata TaxID=231223 RepID=A0AAE1DG95_9GAST|nr:hypothetical protein RRG08_009564 [Elysia crispata]